MLGVSLLVQSGLDLRAIHGKGCSWRGRSVWEEALQQKLREQCVGVRGEEANNRETGRPEGTEETCGPQGLDDKC